MDVCTNYNINSYLIKARVISCLVAQLISNVFSAVDRRAEAGTNYRGPEVPKEARGPTVLHMFLYFSVVTLSADRTN